MERLIGLTMVFGAVLFLTPHLAEEGQATDKAELFGFHLDLCQEARAAGVPDKCALYGKIKGVEHHEDVKIKKVEHHEDIRVKWVDHNPSGPGEWESVEHHEDYKVKFVEHHEDYKIKEVEHHEGCD